MKRILTIMAITTAFSFNVSAFEVDKEKSNLAWKGTKVSGEHYGTLKFKEANAKVKEGKLVGGEFVVDMNSMTVTDLEGEWEKKFLTHMKSGDFFAVEKYPVSKLVINSVEGNKVKATLSVKDKSGPVTFNYKKEGKAFVGDFKFDRTKFGMIYNSGNFFKDLGDKLIHNDVLVNFKLVPKK
ncbi:MAG: lipid-binding protein [Halobacteriovoraceae bacterium]|nr:lipid-binding protein [Halobacteriovoraceae bacterium]|tara:strand:+ start:36200 stop:36745 length:546 start_codon:yes stop_codon:yes gene_type:complete